MSVFTYKQTLEKAKSIKNYTEKQYKLGESIKWGYYICKSIVKPKTNITQIKFDTAPNPATADAISRGINKNDYLKAVKWVITYVETKGKMPNWVPLGDKKVGIKVFCYFIAKILVYYNSKNTLPATMNINSKCFTKPTETGNKVYDYACKKFGRKFKTMDEILEYVTKYFTYQFYYDDQKSNKQVTDSKAGNCTDLLQWLINMLEALGYEWKVLHVQCSSGVGHVRGMFKHKKYTENTWVYRDIAAVADGDGIRTNWCITGFKLLSTDPSWFLENLRR